MVNKRVAFLIFIFVIYLFLLKGYLNLLLATLVFAYFTEVFIDIFSSYKEKLLKSIESKMNVNRYRKFQLVFFLLGLFRKLRINVFFVYLFYLFAVLFFILFIFVPILGQVISVMKIGLERVPYIVENIRRFIDKFLSGYNVTFDTNYVFSNLGNLVNVVLNAVAKFLGGVLSNLGDWFILILVPLLGLYFINAKKDFIEWLSVNFDNHLVSFFRMFDYYQKVYIRAILVNVLSIVILSSVVFSFFLGVDGVSYGVVYGLFSFIPIVGPILGSLPVVIVSFGKSLFDGIVMVVLVFLIQQLSDNFIMPKTVERFMVVSPFLSIISILAFYTIFNFWAIFIAVPLTLTLKYLIENKEER